MQYILFKQFRKVKKVGVGTLAVSGGNANFFDNEKLIEQLFRVSIDFINPDGIMLSGFEHTGAERSGRKKYAFQSWFLKYYLEDK